MTTTLSNGTPCGLETDSKSDSSTPSLSPDESDAELDNINRHPHPATSSGSHFSSPGHKSSESSMDSESDVAGWWLPADGHSVALVVSMERLAKIFASLPLIGFLFCFSYSMLYQFDQVIDKDCPVFILAPTISSLTSQAPGRYLWRILIALHSAPRLLALLVYWTYYERVLTTYIEPRFRLRAAAKAKAKAKTCATAASGTPISSASVRSTSLRRRRTQPEPQKQHELQQQQQLEKKGHASANANGNGNGNGSSNGNGIDNCALHESCAGDRAAASSEGDARLPNPVSFRRWMYATLAMAAAENLLMLIVTYISNKENYPVHEKAFLLYGLCSGLYMPFSVRLYRLCCDALPHGWTPERRATYRFKSRVCYTCMCTFFVMGICFYGYIGFCLPIVFSIFVILEYLMLVLNTVFHYGVLRDFPGLKLILARPVPVLNESAVSSQIPGALAGAIDPSTFPVSSSSK